MTGIDGREAERVWMTSKGESASCVNKGQVVELQSLRGIAATVVMIHHASYVFEMPVASRLALDAVLNAHAAIVLFFVLSGYVLTVSIMRTGLGLRAILQYAVRRLFRIYPGLIVATLLGLIYAATLSGQPIPGVSDWGDGRMEVARLSALVIGVSLLGWPYLLPPTYTIMIELLGSALLPLLVVIINRGWMATMAMLAALLVLSFVAGSLGGRGVWLMFLIDFAMGALLASRTQGKRFEDRRLLVLGLLSAAGLVFFRGIWMWGITGEAQPLTNDYHNPVSALAEGVFSCGLVGAIVLGVGQFEWLRGRIIEWLGDISYGIYLLHLPIAFFVAQALGLLPWPDGAWGLRTALIIVLTATATVAAASLLYERVEQPGIAMGKRISGRSVSTA